ncbi:Armadillo-type fold [Sesbania bispinosa]|nr:Armadillo-type fold [Sesbania bispinosa]
MATPNETGNLIERDTVKRLKHMGRKLLRNLPSVDKLLEQLDCLGLGGFIHMSNWVFPLMARDLEYHTKVLHHEEVNTLARQEQGKRCSIAKGANLPFSPMQPLTSTRKPTLLFSLAGLLVNDQPYINCMVGHTSDFTEEQCPRNSFWTRIKTLPCKLELVLSSLDQAPTKIIQESLVPSMKALISDTLLRHTDEDVKVSVTSCFSEISRITAPDAPFDDEQMKEIFKLTVAAFEKLSHVSGRGYEKALHILDNVSKVRLFLVMQDLECDDLIIEMFQHFLRTIRSNHPSNAIRSMESIMTLVLLESEEISPDLLRPLLDSVRKENQTISPISWTLGEKVISNCAIKLKPYLKIAVESSGRALHEYAQIVISICQSQSESPHCDHSIGSKKTVVEEVNNKLDVPKDADEQPCDVTEGLEPDITCVRDSQIMDDSKSNVRSANATTMDGERGRKPNSLMNEEEGYDHSWIYVGTKAAKPALSRKAPNSSSAFPPSENPTSGKDKLKPNAKTTSEVLVSKPNNENIAKPAQSRKTRDVGSDFPPYEKPASSKDNVLSKPEDMREGHETLVAKPKNDENTDAFPPSTNHNIPDGSRPKRGRPRKISSNGNKDVQPNSMSMLKEGDLNPLLEKTSLEFPGVRLEKESEVKPQSSIRKIKFSVKFDGKTMESEFFCKDEGNHKSAMNIEVENREEGRPSAQTEIKKKRRHNATPDKSPNKSSAMKGLITESANKTLSGIEETPQAGLRRRHITASGEASESLELRNSLVGRRIKVWWPLDKTFYEGVIDSYDPVRGKHKILYADGDEEVLNLKKQRWELVDVDVSSGEAEEGLGLKKLAEASDIAEKIIENSEVESSAKGATVGRKESAGKRKTKRMKTDGH